MGRNGIMRDEIMGDDLLGDELYGDELYGDEIMGDELYGDDVYGDQLVGDDVYGDELLGDDVYGDDVYGDELLGDDVYGDDGVYGDDLIGITRRRRRRRRARRAAAREQARRRREEALARKRAAAGRRRRPPRCASPADIAMAERKAFTGKVVSSKGYTKGRVQSIGFTSLAVAPGTTVDIPSRPQELFRGTRLVIPSSIAASVVVEDIKVGRSSQFVASGAQPGEAFKDTATGDNVSLDTARPGMDITLKITNVGGTAVDFRATLFGDVVE
jgi:hypothetical protein